MAATLTFSTERARDLRRLSYAVTSHTDGVAAVTFTYAAGFIIDRVDVVPNKSTDQPTAAFGFTLKTDKGIDLLDGAGLGLDNGSDKSIQPKLVPCPVVGTLTLAFAGMGSGKKCDVHIYARPNN
jgi:hypothetical protein